MYMASKLSGQTSLFGVIFFLSKFLLEIEGQKKKKRKKSTSLSRKPRSHVRIMLHGTWPIHNFPSFFQQ